jgi:CRP/FNR family transcriptional regulator
VRLADPDLSVQRFLRELAVRIGREEPSGSTPAIRIRLPMSRMEIGQYLGYAEETVCRSMHRLRRQGEIEVSGRTLLLKSKGPALKPVAVQAATAP